MAEIDATNLVCNGCWATIVDLVAYKTSCSHLFCRPCAESCVCFSLKTLAPREHNPPHPPPPPPRGRSYFTSSTLCPLCDARLGGDGDIVELAADKSPAACLRAFSLAAFHPETALRLLTDAVTFSRGQTALYGTREAWKKGQESEGLKRRLVEAENRLHTLLAELGAKAGEVADLQDRLALKVKEVAAQKAERKRYEEAYARSTGGRGGALLLGAGGGGGGGPSPLGEGSSFFGGGGGGHTVVVMPPSALGGGGGRRDSVSSVRGGGGGGGGPGALSAAAAAAAAAEVQRRQGASLFRPLTPLTGPGTGCRGGASSRSGGGGGGGGQAPASLFPGGGTGWGGSGGGR